MKSHWEEYIINLILLMVLSIRLNIARGPFNVAFKIPLVSRMGLDASAFVSEPGGYVDIENYGKLNLISGYGVIKRYGFGFYGDILRSTYVDLQFSLKSSYRRLSGQVVYVRIENGWNEPLWKEVFIPDQWGLEPNFVIRVKPIKQLSLQLIYGKEIWFSDPKRIYFFSLNIGYTWKWKKDKNK